MNETAGWVGMKHACNQRVNGIELWEIDKKETK